MPPAPAHGDLLSTGMRLSQQLSPHSYQPLCKTFQEKADQALGVDLSLREFLQAHCITWTRKNTLEKHPPIPSSSKTSLTYFYPVPHFQQPPSPPHPTCPLLIEAIFLRENRRRPYLLCVEFTRDSPPALVILLVDTFPVRGRGV